MRDVGDEFGPGVLRQVLLRDVAEDDQRAEDVAVVLRREQRIGLERDLARRCSIEGDFGLRSASRGAAVTLVAHQKGQHVAIGAPLLRWLADDLIACRPEQWLDLGVGECDDARFIHDQHALRQRVQHGFDLALLVGEQAIRCHRGQALGFQFADSRLGRLQELAEALDEIVQSAGLAGKRRRRCIDRRGHVLDLPAERGQRLHLAAHQEVEQRCQQEHWQSEQGREGDLFEPQQWRRGEVANAHETGEIPVAHHRAVKLDDASPVFRRAQFAFAEPASRLLR